MTRRPPRLARLPLRVIVVGCVLATRTIGPAQTEPPPAPTAVADPAAAALAGFDETTGLWFPPDAPREVYLARSDPNHDLIRDMQKAFTASPALRKAACALATDPKREVRAAALDMSVKQRITMFHMLCAGADAAERDKQRREDVWQENEARFEKARNAKAARALSFEERRARFFELDGEGTPTVDAFVRLDRAFEMLGLMPQSEGAVYSVLDVSPFRNTPANSRFQDSLRQLFDRESSEGMPEAARYRMGRQYFLYLTNHLPEARAAVQVVLEEKSLSRWKTDNLAFLGFLDRLAGDVSALKRAASRCSAPEREAMNYGDRPEGAYCYDLYLGFAYRYMKLNGETAPATLIDAIEEVLSTEPANWPRRTTAIQYVVRLDPVRGRALAEELLQIPATITPLDARLDALEFLATASRKLRDFGRALAAFDRYLAFLHYRPTPIPPSLWARLTVLPEREEGAPAPFERSGWLSIAWALGEKVATSTDAGDFAGARRATEAYLANALNLARMTEGETEKERIAQLVDLEDLNPKEREAVEAYLKQEAGVVQRTSRDQARWTRSYLRSYGSALLKAGKEGEAKRLAAYLIAQPGGDHNLPTELYPIFYGAKIKGEPFPPAASPWDAEPATTAAPVRRR